MRVKALLISILLFESASLFAQPCLQGSFPMNGDANDAFGSSDGVVSGATLVPDRFGNPNSAYDFNGTSDHIDIPNTYDYPERTICLWFNASSTSTTIGNIIVIDHPGLVHGNMSIVTVNVGGADYVRFLGGGIGSNSYDYPISTGVWYHVAMVKDASGYRYYVNCNLVSTKPAANNTSSSGDAVTRLGAERLLSINRFFHGMIDSVSITNCALNTQQICNKYNNVAEAYQNKTVFSVYPNPASIGSNLYYTVQGEQPSMLEIINALGEKVYAQQVNASGDIYLDPAKYAPGMYFARLSTGNGMPVTQKFILE